VTVREVLAWGRRQLQTEASGPLEAEILLCKALDVSRAWLYANPECPCDPVPVSEYKALLERRSQGVPVAYLTGQREFWSLPLTITPDVLIPRPETELLVETVLKEVPRTAQWRIADLGTGSGAIALAIAVERSSCEIHATEFSDAALQVAMGNGRTIAPGRVQFHLGSWLAPLTGRFDVVVSNPPYVAAGDRHLQQGDCRHEPRDALTPGKDALAAFRLIADEARGYLRPGGMLVFEHGYDQGDALRELMTDLDYRAVETRKDLENRDRVTLGKAA
jgi:release factor glutamine methyltransferase